MQTTFEMYASEVASWLHMGLRLLIDKVLQCHVNDSDTIRTVLEIGAGVGQNISVLHHYGVVDINEIDEIELRNSKTMLLFVKSIQNRFHSYATSFMISFVRLTSSNISRAILPPCNGSLTRLSQTVS